MINDFEIMLFKPFKRLRNKAQLFSGLADDHYHTRLLHSIEVEKISKIIADKVIQNKIAANVDYSKLSAIALLHDIGHTPYGHIGERTIHKICSGKLKIENFDDFCKLKVSCGFKHNINSAILLKEELIKRKQSINKWDVEVLDGVVKHSGLFYKGDKKLNYQFEYLNSTLNPKLSFTETPMTLEGKIVFFADEIAQIISDYNDLKNSNAKIGKFNNLSFLKPLKTNTNINEALITIVDNLCNEFVDELSKTKSFAKLKKGKFAKKIKQFGKIRGAMIKTFTPISIHDKLKETNIIELYKFFFTNPFNDLDIYKDFINRIKRIKLHKEVITKITNLKTKKDCVNFLFKEVMPKCRKRGKVSRNVQKSYRKIYTMYIWTIGIHISKMTDNFADHKISKIAKTML